jgi:hypothetical protein
LSFGETLLAHGWGKLAWERSWAIDISLTVEKQCGQSQSTGIPLGPGERNETHFVERSLTLGHVSIFVAEGHLRLREMGEKQSRKPSPIMDAHQFPRVPYVGRKEGVEWNIAHGCFCPWRTPWHPPSPGPSPLTRESKDPIQMHGKLRRKRRAGKSRTKDEGWMEEAGGEGGLRSFVVAAAAALRRIPSIPP